MKTAKFGELKIHAAFTPAYGHGKTSVYIKQENGICPQVGVLDKEGIFWPDDRVIPTKLPDVIIKRTLFPEHKKIQ